MAATRILIVDDVQRVRDELSTILQLDGNIDVAGMAANGLEAISLTQALRPEVILMDLEMPILDGYEATRQIKSQYPGCRVVALTIHGYALAREKAFRAGVDDFVEKGAPLNTLVQAILFPKE